MTDAPTIPEPRPTKADIERVEAALLALPQAECPLGQYFAPGVYLRRILMRAGTFVIGQEHKTEHFNIVLTGKALVMMNGETEAIRAPHVFVSGVGVRKVLYIVEDMEWITVHPTEETNLEKLESDLIVKSNAFIQHQLKQDAEKLRLAVEAEEISCLGSQPQS